MSFKWKECFVVPRVDVLLTPLDSNRLTLREGLLSSHEAHDD